MMRIKKNRRIYPYDHKRFTGTYRKFYTSEGEITEVELDHILNELRKHYPKSIHDSIYGSGINNIEKKLIAIGRAILRTIRTVPQFKELLPKIQIAAAPDEDYEANFFYVIVYLNRKRINEAVEAFDKLEDNILSEYPDKDINIHYNLY